MVGKTEPLPGLYGICRKILDSCVHHPRKDLQGHTRPSKVHQSHVGQQVGSKGCRWICDPFMCGMDKPSFIPSFVIRYLRDLVRYLGNLTNMIIGEKISRTGLPHRVQPQARTICSLTCSVSARVPSPTISWRTLGRHMTSLSLTSAATPQSPKFRPL